MFNIPCSKRLSDPRCKPLDQGCGYISIIFIHPDDFEPWMLRFQGLCPFYWITDIEDVKEWVDKYEELYSNPCEGG